MLAAALLAFAPSAAAQTDLGPRVDEHLQRLVPWGFSGSILLSRSGRVVLASGYGFADRARGLSNDGQTLFPLGALSQQFTAAAVLLLADQGRLSIDDSLSAHLEGVPADKAGITLAHLLRQQSGLPQDVGALLGQAESREEALARCLSATLSFPPGTSFQSSNAGYALLAAVVERVGGLPFDQFLRTRLFDPAGMRASRLVGAAELGGAPLACGYLDSDEPIVVAEWQASWPLLGAGAVLSCVGDLYRWERALSGDTLLSARGLELLHEPVASKLACGLFVERGEGGRRVAQRSGSLPGFQSELRRGLDDGLTWVLLLNEPMPAAVLHVDALLGGRALPLPPEVEAFDAQQAQAVAGAYELPGGGRLRVNYERGRLSVAAENQGGVEALSPASPAEKTWNDENAARAIALCDSLRGRDFPAAANLLGRTAQQVDGELGTWWRRLEERLGASNGAKLQAALARERAVVLRLEFERGAESFRFVWDERGLLDIQPGPASFLVGRLWPDKQGGLVTYDPQSLAVRQLALMLRADGSVRGLSFPGAAAEASELGARRLD